MFCVKSAFEWLLYVFNNVTAIRLRFGYRYVYSFIRDWQYSYNICLRLYAILIRILLFDIASGERPHVLCKVITMLLPGVEYRCVSYVICCIAVYKCVICKVYADDLETFSRSPLELPAIYGPITYTFQGPNIALFSPLKHPKQCFTKLNVCLLFTMCLWGCYLFPRRCLQCVCCFFTGVY